MIPNRLPKSLEDNPRLSTWIGFERAGTVRVSTGKVELGQGVVTALAQIAAEELDVSPDRLRMQAGRTAGGPNEGYTAGSLSIDVSGGSLRLVCAEVRSLFLAEAALRLGRPSEALAIDDGAILDGDRPSGIDYWTLAAEIDLDRPATGAAPPKRVDAYRVVGRSRPRLDLPAKLTGAAFIHDFAPGPGAALHARVLRQPWRGARLLALDEARLRRAARRPIEILREGSYAALLSEDEASLEAAAATAREIAVWEPGGPPDDVAAPAWLRAATGQDRVTETGAGDAAPADLPIVADYSRPLIAHASIAPSCALARLAADGLLTVWTHSQGVFPLRASLATALAMPPDRIAVEHVPGAGCYGHNGADDVAFDAAFLALRRPDRVVRVQWTRADEFAASPLGAAMTIRLAARLDAGGSPAEWVTEIWSAPHGQRPGMSGHVNLVGPEALPDAPAPPRPSDVPDSNGAGAARNASPPYGIARHRLITHFLDAYPVRTSSLRGLGAFLNVFAIERFVDQLAEETGSDPVAYRLGLLADPRARAVVAAAAEMAGWTAAAEIGTGSALGLGYSRYKNKAGHCAVVAAVTLDETVRIDRVWCAVDAGLVVNPDGARNQIEGGIIQGASWTLKEEVRIAEGRVASTTWETYPILRFSEVPPIEIRLVDMASEPPLGLGEVSQGPTAAAIGNAVARALGAPIHDLPLSRERILAALA